MKIQEINNNSRLSLENAIKTAKNNPKTYYISSGMSRDTFGGTLESHMLCDVHRTTNSHRRNLTYNTENGDLLVHMRSYNNGDVYILPHNKTRWVYVNKEAAYYNIPKFKSNKTFINYWKKMLTKIK